MWFPNNKPNVASGTKTQLNNNTTIVVTTTLPNPATHGRGPGEKVTAVIAWGKRPVPFRTRKLRPTAPMVLHPGGCGRVGHRRTTIRSRPPNPHGSGGLPHQPPKHHESPANRRGFQRLTTRTGYPAKNSDNSVISLSGALFGPSWPNPGRMV